MVNEISNLEQDGVLPTVPEGEDDVGIVIDMAEDAILTAYLTIPGVMRGVLEGTANCLR